METHKHYRNLEDFLLVMWKNLVLKYRRFYSTAIEILFPIISCLVALFVMSHGKQIEHTARTYPSFNIAIKLPP